jgi:serine/threonine protein kinase
MDRIGKYELVREIGRGATSAVYLANDPFAGRQVAVKLVKQEALGDRDYGRRFQKLFLTEASLVGKLNHPHIAAIYDAVADIDGSYIVMEFIDGPTLDEFCRVENLMPMARVVELIFKCCKALDYALRIGIIHRDIKPANILMAPDGEIKISDFGAALSLASETTQVTGVGSPAYMSPEQVRDQQLNHQTDIFSLGVVMYQLLTGRLPFKATNNFSMVYQIINVDPPPPSVHRPEIPQAVDVIVKKALQKSLDRRYQSWNEFSSALAAVFGDLRSIAQPVPEAEKFSTLRDLEFFHGFGDADLWQVVRISSWSRHPAGTAAQRQHRRGLHHRHRQRGRPHADPDGHRGTDGQQRHGPDGQPDGLSPCGRVAPAALNESTHHATDDCTPAVDPHAGHHRPAGGGRGHRGHPHHRADQRGSRKAGHRRDQAL